MSKIEIYSYHRLSVDPNSFESFFKKSKSKSHTVLEINEYLKIFREEINIYFDYIPISKLNLNSFNVLILWEPKSVIPIQYKSSYYTKFNLVITLSEERAKNIGIDDWICHPYEITENVEQNTMKSLICIINSNKFSGFKESNYLFRRKCISTLKKNKIELHIFGQDWKINKIKEIRMRWGAIKTSISSGNFPSIQHVFSNFFQNYPNYLGALPFGVTINSSKSKIKILKNYMFSLVIENESDWVTEKIYDALVAKSVPVYYGPSLKNYPKLAKCVVEFKSIPELINFFSNSDERLYDIYKLKLHQIDELLKNKDFWNSISYNSISEQLWNFILRKYKREI